jgi:hypothetical protein
MPIIMIVRNANIQILNKDYLQTRSSS